MSRSPVRHYRLCNEYSISVEDKPWLSRLPVGQAIVKMQDRWREPFLIEIPHVPVEKGAISDAAFKQANTGLPTGSGLSSSISGNRDGFGQVLVGDQPLDPAALSLIRLKQDWRRNT